MAPNEEPDFLPEEESTSDFYELSRHVRDCVAKGEPVPADCMPHEHPLWIVIGAILGKQSGKPVSASKDGQISAELVRKLESSLQKMLKTPEGGKTNSSQVPVYICAGLTFCCVLLFAALYLTAPKIPQGLSSLVEEMRTCRGPHVMLLEDGSCTMRISQEKNILSTYSWHYQK